MTADAPTPAAPHWVSNLTAVAQDYLKAIWSAQEWSSSAVTTSMLAKRFGVSASTASEAVRRLADQDLVVHERYGAVSLTERGRTGAILMVRRHRLIETFLVRELGYEWDQVHDEADILEHAVSERFVHRLDLKLGRPDFDPHGDPIPDDVGNVPRRAGQLLAEVPTGTGGCVTRISDGDPAMLRYLTSIGIDIGCRVTVAQRRPYAGTVAIRVENTALENTGIENGDSAPVVDLGDVAARAIWVDSAVRPVAGA